MSRLTFGAAMMGFLVGCGSDLAAPRPAPDPSQLYWALSLDHRAVSLSTVAPYDTLQLTATPRSAFGDALPAFGSVVFASTNPAYVRVSPSGLLTGVAPGSQTQVIATLTLGNVTRADTATVNVTADSVPPVLATFSIHPIPPDSAKRGATPFPYLWPVYAADAAGNPIPNLVTACTSSDPTVATVLPSCGLIFTQRPGHVVITASTTAWGVSKADTLDFTVGQWLFAGVSITQGAGSLRAATIAIGGTVFWFNQTNQPIDITFSDSADVTQDSFCQCGSGNIRALQPGGLAGRAFPVPGSYLYNSVAAQASGTIDVVTD